MATQAPTEADREAFARALERAARAIARREDQAVRDVTALLTDLRRSVLAELVDASPGSGRAVSLHRLLATLDGSISTFVSGATLAVQDAQADTWTLAADAVRNGLRAAQIDVLLPALSTEQLGVLTAWSADLVQGVGQETRAQLAPIIRQAASGLLTPQQAQRRIAKLLTTAGEKRGSAAAKAETIVRTSVLQVFSMAQHERLSQATEAGVLLRKQWLSAHDKRVRPAHKAADGQIVAADATFTVGGERARYPRDPRLTSAQAYRCRCVMTAIVDGIEA